MADVLSRLNGGEVLGLFGILLGLTAVIGGIVVAIVKTVEQHYRKSQLNEMEATLKMEMIQRGMSAGEIKQVLEAKMGSARPSSWGEFLGSLPSLRMPGSLGKEPKNS